VQTDIALLEICLIFIVLSRYTKSILKYMFDRELLWKISFNKMLIELI